MFFLCFDLWFMLNGTKLDTSGSQGHEETLFKRDVKQFEYCSLQICMGVNCVCPVFLFSGLESVLWHSIGISVMSKRLPFRYKFTWVSIVFVSTCF